MSERLANVLSRMKMRGAPVREDEVLFAGGVNTEDVYGGNLGQGAMRDCHNVEIAERGYRTKGGWVRFGPSSYATPHQDARVVYCKYEYYTGLGSVYCIPPAANTIINNFNGSGEDAFVLSSRWREGYEGNDYYISFYLEVFFLVFPDSDLTIYEGSTIGTDQSTLDPGWTWSGGPYAIEDLGQDPIDVANDALGLDVLRTDEDIDSYRIAGYNAYRGSVSQAHSTAYDGVGLFTYKNRVYVIVDYGSTYSIMKCEPGTSWTDVLPALPTPHLILYFENGSVPVDEGASMEGVTSSATATAYRVVIIDGTFEGGDASGYFSISNDHSGTFVAGEDIKVGSTVCAQVVGSGDTTGNIHSMLNAAGTPKLRYVKYNFSGFENREAVYFVTGTSYAFEFFYDEVNDVYVVTPIKTMIGIDDFNDADPEDTPDYIAVNRNTLFLGYNGGSIQNSASGDPLDFRAIVGYDEKSIGEDITNFVPEIGGSLLISAKNSWWALYGDNQQNYDLQLISSDVGALPDTVSSAAGVLFLDAQGLTTLQQAAEFGNWSVNALTKSIDKKMQWLLKYCTPVKTLMIRDRSIVRFFFDQTISAENDSDPVTLWLAVKFGKGGIEGYTFGSYNRRIVDVCEGEMTMVDGRPQTREVFFLATDGYVYRDEQNCVADDEYLTYSIDTTVLVGRSKGVNKHWHEVFFDAYSQSISSADVEMTFHDSNGYRRKAPARSITLSSETSYWDSNNWDSAYWDSTGGNIVRMKMMGLGVGVSFNITGSKFNSPPDFYRSVKLNFIPLETRRVR